MTTEDAIGEMVETAFRLYGGRGSAGARVIRMKTPLGKIPRRELQRMAAIDLDRPKRTFRLVLDMPPSANRYWRRNPHGGVYVSQEAAEYKDYVAVIAHSQGVKDAVAGEVAVTVRVYRKQRSGDLDNRLKVLIDALKGVAYCDDKQITEIHAYQFEDAKNPRVEVEITEK